MNCKICSNKRSKTIFKCNNCGLKFCNNCGDKINRICCLCEQSKTNNSED